MERDGAEMEGKSNQGGEQEGGRTLCKPGGAADANTLHGKGHAWLAGLKEAQCAQSTENKGHGMRPGQVDLFPTGNGLLRPC